MVVCELQLLPPAWLASVQKLLPPTLMPRGCQNPVTIIPVALIDQGVASLCLAGITVSADSSERRVEGLRGAEAGIRGSCDPVAQHTRMGWGKGAWMSGCRLDCHCLLAPHTGPASCAARALAQEKCWNVRMGVGSSRLQHD